MLFKTPGRRSSYLSEDSVFDTLTDAILVGEAKSSILREEGAKAEARRGKVMKEFSLALALSPLFLCCIRYELRDLVRVSHWHSCNT